MPTSRRPALGDARRVATALRVRARRLWRNPASTAFARDARPGPTARTFQAIRHVPGWFTYDDACHFTLALRLQTASGLRGDILEIGSYHGRSTVFLAQGLQPGETLTVCDPFQLGEVYVGRPPTAADLRRHLVDALDDVDEGALEIIEAYSTDLELAPDRRFRFVHVDGSHERADVHHDLELALRHLAPGGLIVCDDHDHPQWPGVTEAIEQFRGEHPELVEIADLNRYAESGRKLYLTTRR